MVQSPVAQRIRELIVNGTLPPGARVAEAAIAELLGVSRTPVRNALPALATEGLLEPYGRRGFAVRRFTLEDSLRGTELRCLLEGFAARRIAERGADAELIRDLRDCLAEGDAIFANGSFTEGAEIRYGTVNRRFHRLIVEACDDPLLIELIDRVYALPFVHPGVVAFKIPLQELFSALLSGHHQHHAMVDALEAGQADLLETLIRSHSMPARRSFALERRPAQPEAA